MLFLLFGLVFASLNLKEWDPDDFTGDKWYEGSVEITPLAFIRMPHNSLTLEWVDTHGLKGKKSLFAKTEKRSKAKYVDDELSFKDTFKEKKMFNYKFQTIAFNVIHGSNVIGTAAIPVKKLRMLHGFHTAYPIVGDSLVKEYIVDIKLKPKYKVFGKNMFCCSGTNIEDPQLKVKINSTFYTIKTEVGIPILVPRDLKVAAGWDNTDKAKPDLDPSLTLMIPHKSARETVSRSIHSRASEVINNNDLVEDNLLFWRTTKSASKNRWRISKDNQSGEGGGDDEVLFIDLDYLQKETKLPFGTKILVSIFSYKGDDMGKSIQDGYIRLASVSKNYSNTAKENYTVAYERVGTGEFNIFQEKSKTETAVTGYLFGVVHQGPLIPDDKLELYHKQNKDYENWYFTALEKPLKSSGSKRAAVDYISVVEEMFQYVNDQQNQNWDELEKNYITPYQAPDFSQFYDRNQHFTMPDEQIDHNDIFIGSEEVLVPDYEEDFTVDHAELQKFIGYTDYVTHNMYAQAVKFDK